MSVVVWERLAVAVAVAAVIAAWCALLRRAPQPDRIEEDVPQPGPTPDVDDGPADDGWDDPETRLEDTTPWVDPEAPAAPDDRRAAA